MAFNPSRSWATTYSQIWNICMKDPLTNRHHGNGQLRNDGGGNHHGFANSSKFASNQNNNNVTVNKGGPGGKRSKYCWSFNRGVQCKWKNCKFIERCSYCDAAAHRRYNCPKLEGKERDNASPLANSNN